MQWYHFVAYFFGGAFFVNAIPHFTNGVSGRMFPTPFASPPGKGLSSADSQRALGVAEFGRRVSAGFSGRNVRFPSHPRRAHRRSRGLADGSHAVADIRRYR
jgi:hypothetical protein